MRNLIIVMAGMLFLLTSCYKARNINLLSGLWKIDKIEVLENDSLKQTIESGYQYWNFWKKDRLEIFDTVHVQNTMRLKIGRHTIKSLDSETGNPKEQFYIDRLNKHQLQLSSRKKLNEDDYTIIYYLDKVGDKTAGEILETFN